MSRSPVNHLQPVQLKVAALIVAAALASGGCGQTDPTAGAAPPNASPTTATTPVEPADTLALPAAPQLALNAYYGDLHVHTSWSTDAYSGGNRIGPRDAYRFARGEAVTIANGIVTQLATPLDFTAITDHAEGFDVIAACTYPQHPQYESTTCVNMRTPPSDAASFFRTAFARGVQRPARRNPEFCADLQTCLDNARSTWQRTQAVAEEFNDPGHFTTLIGYEFSALLRQFGMLHRNVIFRGTDVIPHAISSADVKNQADFFSQLDAACQPPCAVLTIPHNTNFSWGLTFSRTDEDGSAYTAADLERRARLDRLVEVAQQKGESECRVEIGASDEDCDFEKLFAPCAPGDTGRCATESSFVRNALLDGIQLADERGTNPFQLGMIGSTDTHGSDPGNTDPRHRYEQARGNKTAVENVFSLSHPVVGAMRRTSPGALAAVWAPANTRADIFDALQRREAFATSGSRLRIRFFAGDLPAEMDGREDRLALAYAKAVPMGGELDRQQLGEAPAPRFWAWAARDPDGPGLDRMQIIKGWLADGAQQHKVWDVACGDGRTPDASGTCPATGASVDIATCTATDNGAAELQATFSDPGFDPGQRAFYYLRVIENPSCRWTTWLANSVGIEPPGDVPPTIENRGWSSPIWVQP